MADPVLAQVTPLDFATGGVIEMLEEMLAKAKAGQIRAVAMAYEYSDGDVGHSAQFGHFANRSAVVGRLHVCAQHIIMSDILEWQSNG